MVRGTLACAIFALLSPAEASAHKQDVQRELLVEAWDDGTLHIAARIEVPSGEAKIALKLAAPGPAQIKRLLKRRALHGVTLLVGTASVALGSVEAKLDLGDDQTATRLMLHGTATIPATQVAITVRLDPGAEHLKVRVLPGKRAPTHPSRGKQTRAGVRANLHQGQHLTWQLPARPASKR
jgi:hypothetical protein